MRKKWRKLFRTLKRSTVGGKIQGYSREGVVLCPTWRHLGDQGAKDEKSEEVNPRGRHVWQKRRQTNTNTCWGLARPT